jgi:hypothetical protein
MLFFINWPMAGVYAPAAARETWGKHDVEGCVLTFAPSVLRSQQPCAVNAIGPNELLVSMAAPGYFSGSSGKMLLDLTRRGRPLESGRRISGGEFDALVLDATPAGVTKIKFTFRRPLDSPEYHFYVSSPQRPALPLRFDAPVDAGDLSRQARNWRQANACAIAEADRYFALMSALNGIVHSDVFLTGDVMER